MFVVVEDIYLDDFHLSSFILVLVVNKRRRDDEVKYEVDKNIIKQIMLLQ